MKLVFYSYRGDIAGIAYRCHLEGTETYLLIKQPEYKQILDGFLPKLQTLTDIVKLKPDIIIFDTAGMYEDAEKLEKFGIKTYGTSATIDRILSDTSLSMKFIPDLGIKMPYYQEFAGIPEAVEYIRNKPSNYAVSFPGSMYLPYKGKDLEAKDLLLYLDWLAGKEKEPLKCVVSRQIYGVECSASLFFSAGKPVYPAFSSIYKCGSLTGNLGIMGTPQISLNWFYAIKEPRLVQYFKRTFELAKRVEYNGLLTMNYVIGKDGTVWCTGITTSLNHFYAGLLAQGGVSSLFSGLLVGEMTANTDKRLYCVNLHVCTPTPNKLDLLKMKGMPVILPAGVIPADIFNDNGINRLCGTSSHVCTVVCDSDESFKNVVRKAMIPHIAYRSDGAYILNRDWLKIHETGIV